jgi:phosphoglycerate dehydrogenase-like enzyme
MGEEALGELRAVAPGVEIVPASGAAVAAEIVDAEGFYGGLTPALLRAAPRLRWVQYSAAGVEHALFPELIESDVIFTNAKEIYGSHLADHIMASVLAFNRNFPHLWRCQEREVWESRANQRPMELEGETLLVVGLGGTGRGVVRRAAGFGMRILAVTRRPEAHADFGTGTPAFLNKDVQDAQDGEGSSVEGQGSGIRGQGAGVVEPAERLLDVLPEADHIAVCCALTPETHHLFGDAAFARTKATAFIHNVTRGAIIDTEALMRALREGRLAGAGLDVTDPEPLPAGHPLWKMPNVMVTPHSSGHSPHSGRRMFALFKENLRRFAAGEPLLNVVDKRAQY